MSEEWVLSLLPDGALLPWEDLCREAGRSRADLENILLDLQRCGFPIRAEGGGAGLGFGAPAPHLLLPRLRGKLGRPYRYLGTVTSTQDVLRAWEDAPVGALVLAERQTQGRGRHRRAWESPPGNLYFSVLVEPDVGGWLPLRAGVALAEVTGVGQLKWPNDLLAADGRKLGGILVERAAGRVLLGVGLNVGVAPLPTAAALDEFRPVHRAQLLADSLWALERWLEACPEEVRRAWKRYSCVLGRTVAVRCGDERVEGIAWDLGPGGELLLRTPHGVRRIAAGDVELGPLEHVENPKVGEGEAQGRGSGHGERESPWPSVEQG